MALASGFRAANGANLSEWEYPVAATTTVRQGDAVNVVAGNIKPVDGVAATGDVFGYALEEVVNLGAAGALTIKVEFGRVRPCRYFPLAAAGIPTAANVGSVVYLDTVSCVTTAATGNKLGTLVGFLRANGQAIVDILVKA